MSTKKSRLHIFFLVAARTMYHTAVLAPVLDTDLIQGPDCSYF